LLTVTSAPAFTIVELLDNPALLGRWFAGPTWDRWRAVLAAAFALPMTATARALFSEVAGDRSPPPHRVAELVCAVGRGGGKNSAGSAVAVYLAVTGDYTRLRPGEPGVILCLATDRTQAGISFAYIRGLFDQVPVLRALVERADEDTIDLKNGVSIVVGTNSYRGVRGRTLVCVIYDECAFWRGEDASNPDIEVDSAVSPGLARWPGAMKVIISSVYRRGGLLYQRWRESFGVDDPDRLVVLGTTLQFNSGFNRKVIERELARDRERASAEYLSIWRDDIADFIDREAVEACIEPGCFERPPSKYIAYSAFCDPSGGRSDSFTLAIAHSGDDGRGILDVIREIKPPFSPDGAVREFADLLQSYGIIEVTKDNYAVGWVDERFKEYGITCTAAEKPRSQLYLELLPLINSRRVDLLDNDRLVNQLCALERKVAGSGRDRIDHAPGSHDDVANSVAGVLVSVALAGRYGSWSGLIAEEQRERAARAAAAELRRQEAEAAAERSRRIEVESRLDDTETEIWVQFSRPVGVAYVANWAFPASIKTFQYVPGISCIPRVVWQQHEKYLRSAGARPVNQQKEAA
jgi:hypothetical protein